ncbi:3'-5' exonuclease [Tilletia horrida]|nr:3'-5' exonuclease [Tilletia horrida]
MAQRRALTEAQASDKFKSKDAAKAKDKKPALKKSASTSNLLFNIAGPSNSGNGSGDGGAAQQQRNVPGAGISNTQRKKAAFRGQPILDDLALHSTSADERAEQERKKRIVLGGDDAGASAAKREPGMYVAIDCEMVGVGPNGSESVLARVSLVNWHGYTLYDTFVKPAEKVTDYRTWVSGVRPRDLASAPSFAEVQSRVAELIKGRTLVGHAIQNDLKALLLSHPFPLIRDTSAYQGLRDLARTKYPSLRVLAKLVLGIDIQRHGDAHSSVEDARATMAIFRAHKSAWDQSLRRGPGKKGAPAAAEAADVTMDDHDEDDDDDDEDSSSKKAKSDVKDKDTRRRPADGSEKGREKAAASKGKVSGRPRSASGSDSVPPPFKKKRVASKANWWNDPL